MANLHDFMTSYITTYGNHDPGSLSNVLTELDAAFETEADAIDDLKDAVT